MKQPKIEVYKAKKGWAWRMVAANGRVLASGEQHTRERDAHRAVATMLETAEKLAHAERIDRIKGRTDGVRLVQAAGRDHQGAHRQG